MLREYQTTYCTTCAVQRSSGFSRYKYRVFPCQGACAVSPRGHPSRIAAVWLIGTGGSAVERRGSAMRGNAPVRIRHRNAVRRERLDLRGIPCAVVPCTAWPLGSLGWFALAWDACILPQLLQFVNNEFAKCRKFFCGLSARHANTAAAPVPSDRARRPVPS